MIGFNFEPSLHMVGSNPAHQILQSHGSNQPFLQHMPQVGEVCGISVGLKCPLVHPVLEQAIADRVSLYVRVSRPKLYGPRWPKCKAHLQPGEAHCCWLSETPLPPAGVFSERSNVHGVGKLVRGALATW